MATITYRRLLFRIHVLPKGWLKVRDVSNNVKGYARPFGFYEAQRPVSRSD